MIDFKHGIANELFLFILIHFSETIVIIISKVNFKNRSVQKGLIFHSDRGVNMQTKNLLIQLNLIA